LKRSSGPLANLSSMRRGAVAATILWLFSLGVSTAGWGAPPAAGPGPGSTDDVVTVPLRWESLSRGSRGITLEIARDPGFSDIVYTAEASGSGVTAALPHEGVYHWRLLRPATGGAEVSSPQSGSFAALGVARPGDPPARLQWPAAEGEGISRYRVISRLQNGRTVTSTTTGVEQIVTRGAQAQSVEVEPIAASERVVKGERSGRERHLIFGLKLLGQRSGPPAVAEIPPPAQVPSGAEAPAGGAEGAATAAAAGSPAGTDTAAAAETTPEAETPPATPPAEATGTPAEGDAPAQSSGDFTRLHLVYVGARLIEEDFATRKLESQLDSSASGIGATAGLWSNPRGGLVIDAAAHYHEHAADIDIVTQTGRSRLPFDRARYDLDFSVGFDVLQSFRPRRHSLTIAGQVLMTQLPLLAVDWDGRLDAEVAPPLSSSQLDFVGLSLVYAWQKLPWWVSVRGRVLRPATDEQLVETGQHSGVAVLAEYQFDAGVAMLVGFDGRATQVTRCSADAAQCLEQGKVRTTITTRSVLVGVGAVRLGAL